jgi:hypothetical protein
LILKFEVNTGSAEQHRYLLPAGKRLWSMIKRPFKLAYEDSNEKSHAAGSSRKSQRQISGKRREAQAGHDAETSRARKFGGAGAYCEHQAKYYERRFLSRAASKMKTFLPRQANRSSR